MNRVLISNCTLVCASYKSIKDEIADAKADQAALVVQLQKAQDQLPSLLAEELMLLMQDLPVGT